MTAAPGPVNARKEETGQTTPLSNTPPHTHTSLCCQYGGWGWRFGDSLGHLGPHALCRQFARRAFRCPSAISISLHFADSHQSTPYVDWLAWDDPESGASSSGGEDGPQGCSQRFKGEAPQIHANQCGCPGTHVSPWHGFSERCPLGPKT